MILQLLLNNVGTLNEVDTVLRFSSRSQTVGMYLNQIRKSNSIYFSRYGESDRDKNKGKQGGLQLVAATFKHMFERRGYQLMIIPLTFWSGVEQGFFGADFTAVSILVNPKNHTKS